MKSLFAMTGLLSLFAFAVAADADDAQSSPSGNSVMIITSTGTTAPGGTVHGPCYTGTGSQAASGAKAWS